MKTYPFGDVLGLLLWRKNNVPVKGDWFREVMKYEEEVLSKERSCNNTGKRQDKIVIAGHSGPSGLLQIDGNQKKGRKNRQVIKFDKIGQA